jgi:hypothetical protein
MLSRLFRPLMLEMLVAAHDAGRLQFFGDHAHLADKAAFKAYLAPVHMGVEHPGIMNFPLRSSTCTPGGAAASAGTSTSFPKFESYQAA